MLAPDRVDASLAKLPDLGLLEDQIEKVQRRLHAIPKERVSFDAEIEKLKTTLAQERESLTALEKDKRSKEKDLAEETERIRQRETKLMEIKTNKEYQAAVKEVETAKSVITQGEDKILELMVAIDTHTKTFQGAEKKLTEEEDQIKSKINNLANEETELSGQLIHVQRERDEILKAFSPQTKSLIDKARAIKSHPLAQVSGERCQACHINIPPQMFNEIRKMEKAFQCPSCHRILYFQATIA